MKRVPNRFPRLNLPYKLAIVGEAPGEQEELHGEPFIGPTGNILQRVIQEKGGAFSACFVGNICQFRPPDNNLNYFAWDGTEVSDGLAHLSRDLAQFQPNCVLVLGATALKAAGVVPTKEIKSPIYAFSSSILRCEQIGSPMHGFKFVPTLHPSAVARNWDFLPRFAHAVGRALEEATTPDLSLPSRLLEIDLTAEQLINKLNSLSDCEIAVDIEGGVGGDYPIIKCVGIATSPYHAFIVNPHDFSINEQARILPALARVLWNSSIKKILKNGLYDQFCLTWQWKMPIRNFCYDTMVSGCEINPELPKSLAVQTSVYTREPFYKDERTIGDKSTFYRYCCKDAAVTFEIKESHQKILQAEGQERALAHAQFQMELIPAIHYMMQKGMRYDVDLARERLVEVELSMHEVKSGFDSLAGLEINPNTNNGANSLSNILYKKLHFPPQYRKEKGRKTEKLTSDTEALLTLLQVADRQDIINGILKWRGLESQRRQLIIGADHDGRVRCRYNPVGTETMRFTCAESPTESGANLTTIMKKFRDLYLADEGYDFAQYDLSGADGWTVGAHCNRMGDSTMLDDLRYKIKPAQVIASMYKHGREVGFLDRDALKEICKEVKSGPLYEVSKVVQHGSCYDMKAVTMVKNVLLKSYKKDGVPIYVDKQFCQRLQDHFLLGRYKAIPRWQDWVRYELKRTGPDGRPRRRLESAAGFTRLFFGRIDDPDTIRIALSHEPQVNTTYATSLILHRLWYDPENILPGGRRIIQPLHQIHDALCVQWPQERRAWAISKMESYRSNSIRIAEQDIIIPSEGGYGPNWLETENRV
jgi:uracil-DNA glycosylase family 4